MAKLLIHVGIIVCCLGWQLRPGIYDHVQLSGLATSTMFKAPCGSVFRMQFKLQSHLISKISTNQEYLITSLQIISFISELMLPLSVTYQWLVSFTPLITDLTKSGAAIQSLSSSWNYRWDCIDRGQNQKNIRVEYRNLISNETTTQWKVANE